jgi:hypothetical protein
MKHVRVTSSAVRSIGYDEATAILEVALTTGRLYRYFEVPRAEHASFMDAESKGGYYNAHIKPGYLYEEVKQDLRLSCSRAVLRSRMRKIRSH